MPKKHPHPISRRDFLKISTSLVTLAGLEACSKPFRTTQQPTAFQRAFTYTPTTTTEPTPTETPTPQPTLSPLDQAVLEQGAAQRIPAIEYHGQHSDFPGVGQMRPEWFDDQLRWLAENDFHALSRDDLNGYLFSDLQLPAKSVLLTFDIGSNAARQFDEEMMPRIRDYGLHALAYILADHYMDDSIVCLENACWDHYAHWANSGWVDYGSHSVTHSYMASMPYANALEELLHSKDYIEQRLSVKVDSIAWPFEDVPSTWAAMLQDAGYQSGFGGYARPILECVVYPHDPLWGNLPRLLPYSFPGDYPKLTARTVGITFAELIMRSITPPKQ